jgi:hypothetical protein
MPHEWKIATPALPARNDTDYGQLFTEMLDFSVGC